MNEDKAMFQSMKTSYQDTHSKETTTSLPKTLFCGKFGLTKELFEQGLANGEFHEVETTSGIQYAWTENSHTKKQGEKTAMGWKAESSGGKKAMQTFEGVTNSWKIGLMIKQAPGSSVASGPSLALCDANQKLTDEQWETVKSQCSEASQSLDKMEKEALKLLKDLNEDDEMWVNLLLGCKLHEKHFVLAHFNCAYLCAHKYIYIYIHAQFAQKANKERHGQEHPHAQGQRPKCGDFQGVGVWGKGYDQGLQRHGHQWWHPS